MSVCGLFQGFHPFYSFKSLLGLWGSTGGKEGSL